MCRKDSLRLAAGEASAPLGTDENQIKGVGRLIAVTYMLTLEDPQRFGKSRDMGCYLGLFAD
jgi:transposase